MLTVPMSEAGILWAPSPKCLVSSLPPPQAAGLVRSLLVGQDDITGRRREPLQHWNPPRATVGTRRVDRAAAEAVPRLRLQFRDLPRLRRLRHIFEAALHLRSLSPTISCPSPPRPSQLEQLSALRKRRQCKQKHDDGAAVRGGGHEPEGESELRSGQVSSRVQRARLHT